MTNQEEELKKSIKGNDPSLTESLIRKGVNVNIVFDKEKNLTGATKIFKEWGRLEFQH
jgi:hypothetical protein